MLLSALVLSNIAMPIFAYASVDSNITSNDIFEVSVSNNTDTDELMNIALGNERISLSLDKKAPNFGEFKSEQETKFQKLSKGQTQQIADVLPGVSVRYKKQEQGLKEDFILHGKDAQNTFDLNYDIGSLQAQQLDEQNIILIDKDGAIKTIISAPYMTDAKCTRSTDVTLKILDKKDNILSVKLTADYSWLQSDDREYPIEIDPRYDTLPTKPMQKGDNSEQVALLKNMLFEADIGAGVSWHAVKRDMRNNTFSNVTERFVITFQREMDLTPTGVADANTLAALRMHLERMGILDIQEHTEQFLRRAEERSPSETKGFFAGIADFFSRINLTDLLVTTGTVAVVVGISALCAPATAAGITFMLIGGATIGGMTGGISEYAQQRAVESEVDFGRVAIKFAGGAVKGAVCAIPGAGVGIAGNAWMAGAVAAAGAGEALSCTVKSTGFSGEAVADALINGGAQGLASIPAAALARGVVGLVKPQQSANLLGETKSVQIGKAKEVVKGAGTVGGSVAAENVASSASGDKYDKPSSTTRSTFGRSKATTGPVSKNLLGGSESRQIGTADRFGEDAERLTMKRMVSTNSGNTEAKRDISPDDVYAPLKNDVPRELPTQPQPYGSPVSGSPNMLKQTFETTRMETIVRNQDIARNVPKQSPQYYDAQKANYQSELDKVNGIEQAVQAGQRPPLTEEEKRFIEVTRYTASKQIGRLNDAQRGDSVQRRRLNNESYMEPHRVFQSQMSTPSVQEILKFGRIISRWQEDGEILIGLRE